MTLKKKMNLLNVIGYSLIGLQVLGFLGNLGKKKVPIEDTAELIGYYIGSNIFLIIAIILFIKSRSMRKRLNNSLQSEMIDSIGKTK